jgi:hypothetical protein
MFSDSEVGNGAGGIPPRIRSDPSTRFSKS